MHTLYLFPIIVEKQWMHLLCGETCHLPQTVYVLLNFTIIIFIREFNLWNAPRGLNTPGQLWWDVLNDFIMFELITAVITSTAYNNICIRKRIFLKLIFTLRTLRLRNCIVRIAYSYIFKFWTKSSSSIQLYLSWYILLFKCPPQTFSFIFKILG